MTSCLEAERSVLGSILMYGEKAVEAVEAEGLTPDHFWWDSHKLLARACFSLHEQGLPVDDITVARKLEGKQVDPALMDACIQYARPSGIRTHAQFVIEDHGWRERFRQAEELMNAVRSRNEEAWQRLIKGGRPALRVVDGEKAA